MNIAAWDIETTDFKRNVGRILLSSFVPIMPSKMRENVPQKYWPKAYTFRADDPKYRNTKDIIDDSKLALALKEEIEKYDIIVSWNGKMFDKRFLQASLLKAGSEPIRWRWHLDLMWTCRSNFAISSRLDSVQRFLNTDDEKTPLTWDDWARGAAFHKPSMDNIQTHCEQDVKVLAEVYERLHPWIKQLKAGG